MPLFRPTSLTSFLVLTCSSFVPRSKLTREVIKWGIKSHIPRRASAVKLDASVEHASTIASSEEDLPELPPHVVNTFEEMCKALPKSGKQSYDTIAVSMSERNKEHRKLKEVSDGCIEGPVHIL